MKLFSTNLINTVKHCQEYFDFDLPTAYWNRLLRHALDAARLATTHIESEYNVATLSDMRPTHTALRL